MTKEIRFVLRIKNPLDKYLTKRAKQMKISKNRLIVALLESYCTCGVELE